MYSELPQGPYNPVVIITLASLSLLFILYCARPNDTVELIFMQILNDEITPTLRKLKEERSSYLEYQKVMREVEHLSRLSIAFHFVEAEVRSNNCVVVN